MGLESNITEGNKLIAEFMMYHKSVHEDNQGNSIYRVKIRGSNTFHTLITMPHNSSWDWSVPVYSKIQNDDMLDLDSRFELQEDFENAIIQNRVDLGFEAIVTFLKLQKK